MPTVFENSFIGYTYDEVDRILKETDTYKKKLEEYIAYAKSEGYGDDIKSAYESLGFDGTWEQHKKEIMISGMIQEGKMKSFHHIDNDKFYYFLCNGSK
jgi:hypothetical protein